MIKTKQQPGAIVPQTIGGRRASQALQTNPPEIRQSTVKTLPDQFERAAKNRAKLPLFSSNTTFKAARRFTTNVPYQRPLHGHVENGTAPQVAGAKEPPSTNALLNFLNKVIETPGLHNPQNIRKSAAQTAQTARNYGNPTKKA